MSKASEWAEAEKPGRYGWVGWVVGGIGFTGSAVGALAYGGSHNHAWLSIPGISFFASAILALASCVIAANWKTPNRPEVPGIAHINNQGELVVVGVLDPDQALVLARWILDTFGEPSA